MTLLEGLEKNRGKIQEVIKNGMVLHIPEIRKIGSISDEVVKTAVEKRQKYISGIQTHMNNLVARIREIQNSSAEERSVREKEFRELVDEASTYLNSKEELLASAARQAYALAMVETLPLNKRLVMETIKGNSNSRLPGLLGLKVLESGRDANAKNVFTVKVFGEIYKVNGGRNFAVGLIESLTAGAACAAKAAHEFYHGEVAAFKAQATISVIEMLAKKPGLLFLTVPDIRNGDKFVSGGALLAESNGKAIKVFKARGHFQRVMTEIAEAGGTIPVSSLSKERLYLGKILPKDVFRQCWILHAVLRRGIAEARKQEICW